MNSLGGPSFPDYEQENAEHDSFPSNADDTTPTLEIHESSEESDNLATKDVQRHESAHTNLNLKPVSTPFSATIEPTEEGRQPDSLLSESEGGNTTMHLAIDEQQPFDHDAEHDQHSELNESSQNHSLDFPSELEPMVSDRDDEDSNRVVAPSHPFAGLYNLGNTCYLNSALQMLASLDSFREELQRHVPVMEDSTEDSLRQALVNVLERLGNKETVRPDTFKAKIDERSSLFIGYRQQDSHEFLTTLLDLLDEDYKKVPTVAKEADTEMVDVNTHSSSPEPGSETEDCDMNEASPVKKQRIVHDDEDEHVEKTLVPDLSPSQSFKDLQFADIENLLHGNVPPKAPCSSQNFHVTNNGAPKYKLVGGRMSTSGVSLTRWEESASEVASSSDSVKTMSEDADDTTSSENAKPYSPIDDYFTTEVRVCLTCDSCKFRRSHTETYLHLSLEIGSSIASIEEGLRAFFKPEKREIKCEKCFCATALQTTQITKLPKALLFHLKRFIVDVSPDYTSISYHKDQSPVTFAKSLKMDDQDDVLKEILAEDADIPVNLCYGIRSIVNHIGSSASCGHYTADAYRLNSATKEREWFRFNDSYVSNISASEAMENGSSTAYMVLYELEEA